MAAIKTDGTLWAWGNNYMGNLGLNNEVKYSSPVQIPGTTWADISILHYAYQATKTDGTLWSWGYNSIYATLGQNNKVNYSSPVQIGTDTGWDLSKLDTQYATYASGAIKKV